jgi:predicted nucleic acid-binding protein
MKIGYIDANVILRYITKDPPAMAEAARKLFLEAQKGKVVLKIIPLIVAEVVWVLESFYDYPKTQIAETLIQLLLCDGLEVDQSTLLTEALVLYQKKNLDFADALLAVTALQYGPSSIYSFDQHLDRIEGVKRITPGQNA